jgi:hypothetical protein
MLRTRPEDSSSNQSLWLEIDEKALTGTIGTNGSKCRFHITFCRDEEEEIVPTATLGDLLARIIPSFFISIVTINKDEVRIVQDMPLSGAWTLFEVFRLTCDQNDYSVDTDRWA